MSKIVNLFEGSAMETLANSTEGSGIFRNKKLFIPDGIEKRNTARNSTVIHPKEKDTIYIKRHLLKTRGVTTLTRSINNDTVNAMKLIQKIEKNKSLKQTKKLENVNLTDLIQQTNKDFKVALYSL